MNFNFTYSNLWTNLKFNAGKSISRTSGGLNWRIRQDTTPLTYKNNRYKSVAVFAAKQLVMSELEGELNKLIPRFKKHYENSLRDVVLKQQTANYQTLIKNQETQAEKWGSITTSDGHTIIARDKYGTAVKEALMLYYEGEDSISVTDSYNDTEKTYNTKTVCHIDLAPQVSVSSSKNIVMTQVQGRDYTRKELVSGGDLQFSISGNIVSNEMGVYPTDAVKKFIKVMEYNGILKVNFMMFDPFNVTQVIVKDYSLSQQTYKNIQPYSFNCVAVEPDDEVKVTTDTISTFNKELTLSPMNKWYKLILDNKLASMAAEGAVNTTTSSITSATGLGLDALTTNI